jgi:hypothetical protein
MNSIDDTSSPTRGGPNTRRAERLSGPGSFPLAPLLLLLLLLLLL